MLGERSRVGGGGINTRELHACEASNVRLIDLDFNELKHTYLST